MARRVQIPIVVLWLLMALSAPCAASSDVLVSYSFDDGNLDTGPDTFAVFKNAKGRVALSTTFRYSGYSSIEIRDAAGDRDFPELQGYFVRRDKGKLFAHFALLTTDPYQELNIALAGPQWFTLRKDGIAFWMKTEEGFLYHVSDSIPKKLFLMKPFAWYLVDVQYDIDAGTYDLIIHEERGQKPILSLSDQKNAPSQPGSAVDKFSFIGDTGEDTSNVVYYVDDVMVGVDEKITQLPFVAPGRRKLFVDSWNDYHKLVAQKPHDLPAVALADFGISTHEALELKQQDALKFVGGLISGEEIAPKVLQGLSSENCRLLEAISLWNAGRKKLEKGEAVEALSFFEEAAVKVPSGQIYGLYAVLALVSLQRWQEVDLRLSQIYSLWQDDPRFGVASAMVGMARNNLDEAEQWLRKRAEEIPERFLSASIRRVWDGAITPSLIKEIRAQFPDHWPEIIEEPLIAEQYYFVLLWKSRWAEAERYASRMVDHSRNLQLEPSRWQERAGDAAFLSGNSQGALHWYEASLGEQKRIPSVLLKLSDVYFRLGDLEQERVYREMIYGGLSER
jgi:tetratricopeptide (TPR) repeat protein